MNEKQLKILVGVVLVLGLGALLLRDKGGEGDGASRLGDKIYDNFNINAVANMTVSEEGKSVTVNRSGTKGEWVNSELQNYPADFGRVRDLLMKVRDLKVSQSHEIDENLYGRFELGPSHGGKKLELKDTAGKTLYTLLLGKSGGGATWVLDAARPKLVAQVDADFFDASTDADSWKDSKFFSVEKVKSVSVKYDFNGTRTFALSRQENFGAWELAGIQTNQVVNTENTGQLDHALGSPSFTTIATPEQVKAASWDANTTTIDIETFDNFKYHIVLAEQPGGSTMLAKVNVTGDLKPKAPGKDKKGPLKLDVIAVSKRKEKLDWESGLKKWVFVVNNYTFNGVLKNRQDLVKAKEPVKPDPPKPPDNPAPKEPKDEPESGKKKPEPPKKETGKPKDKKKP